MNLRELENLFVTKLTEKYSLTQRDIKRAFTKYDLDGSGYLSTSELSKAILLYCNGVEKGLIDELVRHYDVDQDGVISLEEFSKFLLSRNSSNPKDWITVDHLTSNNESDSPRSSSQRQRQQRTLTRKQSPTRLSSTTRIENPTEHFSKLFLQGMKSVLMKQALEDREAGRIPTKERITQKTSRLIESQSKSTLQRLFAPYITSNTSKGIALPPFKR